MNHIELKTARVLLGLTTQDAAEHIGKMKQRSWEFLEQGRRPIPNDVVQMVRSLINRRREILATIQEKMLRENGNLKNIAVIYYPNPNYCESVLDWRFSQSLAMTLTHDYGANLIEFNEEKYCSWLANNGIVDTQEKRSEWAAFQIKLGEKDE